MNDFEIIPHTADMKLRVYGKTLQELFINALIGMFESMDPCSSQCVVQGDRLVCSYFPIKRIIEINSASIDMLLVDFLSEALCLSDTFNEAYLHVRMIHFADTKIFCELQGVQIESFQGVEIKAVTYHELALQRVENRWQTDIVFDV